MVKEAEKVVAPSDVDQAAMGLAGGRAAAESTQAGKSKEETGEAVTAAVKETAEKRGLSLTEEDYQQFAKAMIKELDAVGAFDAPPEPVQSPAAAAPVSEEQAAAVVIEQQAPPRSKSFAEKFRGGW